MLWPISPALPVWPVRSFPFSTIPASHLPELIGSSGTTGNLRPELANRFGFEKEVKIFAGGADNACGAIGAGIVNAETGMASIGTSGVFLAFEDSAEQDYQGKLHLFNHTIEDGYYSMGVTLAAGHSLNWFKDTFAPDSTFEELLEGIDAIKPGAEGLLFTPYIVGERTPHVDSQIRGSFIGMVTNHTLKHFARAVLEGITFSLKDAQVLMEKVAGKSFKRIVSVGLGWFPTVTACAEVFVAYKDVVQPIPENVTAYEKIYALYTQVYGATKGLCPELAEEAGSGAERA